MRSAKFQVSKMLFFDFIGLKNMDAFITDIKMDYDNKSILIALEGWDYRLPDREDYPESNVICETRQSHFEVIE